MQFDGRPQVFNNTINKRFPSVGVNQIRYEYGHLPSENRIHIENVAREAKSSRLPPGYDGTPIVKETIDIKKEFPFLEWKDPNLLYDKMMNDAHNVFPRNSELKNKVNDYYEQVINRNLNNLYFHAPRFFKENFIQSGTGVMSVDNAAFELYQTYIYLLCFIIFVDTHALDPEIRVMDNITTIKNWISIRRDPNIDFILNGPSTNSDLSKFNFKVHYWMLISPSKDMDEILQYNQLSVAQTINSDLYTLSNFIQTAPNVYIKTPDEARKYNINIDSLSGVMVRIDTNKNLVFDCNGVNLGDTTEQNKLAKYDNLETIITDNVVNSMINAKKLEEIFQNYSRIKINELIFTPDTYITALDAFRKVFVVFDGVSCAERNTYNNMSASHLKIGGKFIRTERGYEFEQDVDVITYKSVLTEVKKFEIYLTTNPGSTNLIVPNEYALAVSKFNILQHPINTGIVYNSNIKASLKLFDVRNTVHHVDVSTYYYDLNNKLSKNYITHSDVNTIRSLLSNKTQIEDIRTGLLYCSNVLSKAYDSVLGSYTIVPFFDAVGVLLYKLMRFIRKISGMNDSLTTTPSTASNVTTSPSSSKREREVKRAIDSERGVIIAYLQLDDLDSGIRDADFLHDLLLSNDEKEELNYLLKTFNYNVIADVFSKLVERTEMIWSEARMDKSNKQFIVFNLDKVSKEMKDTHFTEVYNEFISKFDDMGITSMSGFSKLLLNATSSMLKFDIDDEFIASDCEDAFKLISTQLDYYGEVFGSLSLMYRPYRNTTFFNVTKSATNTNATVDLSTGKINGEYFRLDSKGDVTFVDENGEKYTTPDENFLVYDEQENDICLMNLYKMYGDSINSVVYGSFIYSENLNAIQNLPFELFDFSQVKDTLKFDNIYKAVEAIQSNSPGSGETITAFSKSVMYYLYPNFLGEMIPESTDSEKHVTWDEYQEIVKDPANVNNVYSLYYKFADEKIHVLLDTKEWNVDVYLDNYTNFPADAVISEPARVSFDYKTGAFDGDDDVLIQNIPAVLETDGKPSKNVVIDVSKISKTYRVYGYIYEDNVNDDGLRAAINVFTVSSDNVVSNANEDTSSYTLIVRGLQTYSTRGPLSSITLMDKLGNYTYYNKGANTSGSLTFACESFDSLVDITDKTASQYEQYNVNNVVTTTTVAYTFDSKANVLIISNMVSENNSSNVKYDEMLLYVESGKLVHRTFNSSSNGSAKSDVSYDCLMFPISTDDFGDVCVNLSTMNEINGFQEDQNFNKSNSCNVFNIHGFDVVNKYWNKHMYINSILGCQTPVQHEFEDITLEGESNINIAGVNALSFNTSDANVYIYNFENNVLQTLKGHFLISNTSIMKYENSALKQSGISDLYVDLTRIVNCFSTESQSITSLNPANGSVTIELYDGVHDDARFKIDVTGRYSKISGITLYINTDYDGGADGVAVERFKLVGQSLFDVVSDMPTYIGGYEITISFTVTMDEHKSEFSLNRVTLNYVEYNVKEYKVIDDVVKCRKVDTIKYSNIPGEYITQSERMYLTMNSTTVYKYNPFIKFIENIVVAPKYVNNYDTYMTLVNKFNQNIITGPVLLMRQYTNNTEDYEIANRINSKREYTMESLNDNMLMLGEVNKKGFIDDIAIKSNMVYIVPNTSRMLLSLEFS